jgi:hypothetical protein
MKPQQSQYEIWIGFIDKVGDEHSFSGKKGILKKGKLIKHYTKPTELASSNSQLGQPIIRESKSTYFVKPATTETKDQKAVIISRQMHKTVANSTKYKDIKIAKQRLYNKASYKNYYPLKPLMVSKEVEGLAQKETGKDCQYQYYLGMAQIAGEPDWNPANIGNDKDGNLAVIDIGGPSIKSGNYIGSYLFWEDFFVNTFRVAFNIDKAEFDKFEELLYKGLLDQFKKLLWLSGAPKGDYLGEGRKFFNQKAKMSHETFNDFMIATIKDASTFTSNPSFKKLTQQAPRLEQLSYDANPEYFKHNSEYILENCNKALKETRRDSDLYKQIIAYIDGATEFYYQAPNAVIEEKHILGGDPKKLQQELEEIRNTAFLDFYKLILSFNNAELREYLYEKIEIEYSKSQVNLRNITQLSSKNQNQKIAREVAELQMAQYYSSNNHSNNLFANNHTTIFEQGVELRKETTSQHIAREKLLDSNAQSKRVALSLYSSPKNNYGIVESVNYSSLSKLPPYQSLNNAVSEELSEENIDKIQDEGRVGEIDCLEVDKTNCPEVNKTRYKKYTLKELIEICDSYELEDKPTNNKPETSLIEAKIINRSQNRILPQCLR